MSEETKERVGGAAGYVLCAAGFVLTAAAFYPGLMSPDSVDQWEQGRAWSFNDVHPPVMSALWGLLGRVWEGPAPMLLFHNLLFWGGAALFWRAARRGRRSRLGLAFAAFGFMPQVWALLSTVWKDVGLGASLFLASALLYGAGRRGGRWAVAAAAPLLFYGYGVRLNAAPAVLPLALWSGFLACRLWPRLGARASSFRPLPVVLGLAYFALLTLGVGAATRALTGGLTVHPYQQILLHDLAAISKQEGRPLFPPYVTGSANFSHETVSEKYSTEWVNTLIYGDPPPLPYTWNPAHVADLRAAWWEAVSSHKLAYLEHRWAVYRNLTGFGTLDVYKAFYPATGLNNPPPFRRPTNALTRGLTSYFFFFSNSFLFRGFLWVLACLALCYLALRLRLDGDLGAAFALASSGLLYAAAYFFVTPSSEFRYLWWTVLAATASAILFALHLSGHRELLRRRRAAAATPSPAEGSSPAAD